MAQIRNDYGQGGSGLTVQGGNNRHPDLVVVLRDVATDLANITSTMPNTAPGWSAPITAVGDVGTLAGTWWVLAVHATTAGSVGAKTQVSSGTPAAGSVKVEHGLSEVTFTFAAADAVTEFVVHAIPYTEPPTVLTEAV